MTEFEAKLWLKRSYWLTLVFAALGFAALVWLRGFVFALGFAVGAAASYGNLWVFERLARSLAPGEAQRKPWQAGTYVIRYVLLLGIGYATVEFLGADPFALILGLFTSAAAVLALSIFELTASLFGTRRSQ